MKSLLPPHAVGLLVLLAGTASAQTSLLDASGGIGYLLPNAEGVAGTGHPGASLPIQGPCGPDPFFYDPFSPQPTLTITGQLEAYAVSKSEDDCGIVSIPDQSQLWSMARTFDIGAASGVSSPCTAYLNRILLENVRSSDSSACGGTANADVSFYSNYVAYGSSRSAGVSLGHGAFHIPDLQGGFGPDCCDTDFPCAYAFTGSRTIEPITASIEFNVYQATKVAVDADLTILDCDGDTFDYFAASFSLTGYGEQPLQSCVDGYFFTALLQPGTYTLSATLDYTASSGKSKTCFSEEIEDSVKPLILLDAAVRALPSIHPGPGPFGFSR